MNRTLILSVSIILSASILSIDKINSYIDSKNILPLVSGKVRLGKVYRENLTSTYEVTLDGSKEPIISINAKTTDLYNRVYDDFTQTLEQVNEERKREKKEELSHDNASWNKNAHIKITTQVTYQSEFQPNFVLTIDETNIEHIANDKSSKNIIGYIEELKNYTSRMESKYELQNSFIN
ncbi:hypothetical protein [Aeromonas dhakensis]|uniref:hypothetical protein n=1 Tax=Aeromonas dhakensis TaxID=196024 RepID=UPI000E3D4675|nr:hypothetical protein [Aeromonas dhakensis]RFS28866.1 hypothetical protein DYE42_04235 [Aeromonas dhakensis]